MTNAATGHAVQGRNKGWRKAVRYALTENPVSDYTPAHRIELFKDIDLQRDETAIEPSQKKKRKSVKKKDDDSILSLLD